MIKSSAKDMTTGNIWRLLIEFSIPLLIGNLFQMMYNTVDSLVVGNYVGKEALAAVGSTAIIVNVMVFFFNGFSVGSGVVISRFYGAGDSEGLHAAIETTMFITFLFGIAATVAGIFLVRPMLLFMSTPEDVMESAGIYLRIYFCGMMGLMVYNMGGGILRAVGDTKRPLYFLIFTSVINVILDLVFVLVFDMGVAGVALATILSQFLSAALVLRLLLRTKDIYRFCWKDMKCSRVILKSIVVIGLPTGIQSVITGVSNVFVQGYINYFGSACMAGWSCYNKLDTFIMLPLQSMASAATTFVGQNMGAKKYDRVNKGTVISLVIIVGISAVTCTLLYIFAEQASGFFIDDAEVIGFSALFLRTNMFFFLCNCVCHTLAGALRGRGDSTGPMVIMISTFVGVRQLYLYGITHFVANTAKLVCLSYPVGWVTCFLGEVAYFYFKWIRGDRMKRLQEA